MRRIGASHAVIVGVPSGCLQAVFILAGSRGAIDVRLGALAMGLAILPLAAVRDATGECAGPLAVAPAVLRLTGVGPAVGLHQGAVAVAYAVQKLASVRAAIAPCPGSSAVGLAFAICLAGVLHAAKIGAPARYWIAVVKFAGVLVSIGKFDGACL